VTPTFTLSSKVDKLFSKWDRPDSPGCALGIIKEGELIYKRGYGSANLEYGVPITPKTVFRIGSTSKQFTAFCIALLAWRRDISLDDDVREYIPELPKFEKPIKVRDLIHHTSGLPDYLELMELAGMSHEVNYSPEDVIDVLSRLRGLNFTPGEKYSYSNTNYFLLGVIIERVAGKPLSKFAEENIFKPLGMENTHFHDDHTLIVKNRAVGYAQGGDGFRIHETILDIVGDGGVFTTVEDLYIWDQNFYKNRLEGGDELIKMVLTPGRLSSGEEIKYAFGLIIDKYRGLRVVHHGGAFVGFRAEMMRFPEQKFTVICLCNLATINPTKLAKKIADICLSQYFTEELPTLRPVELPHYKIQGLTGVYANPDAGLACWVDVEGGGLVLNVYGLKLKLIPVSEGVFRTPDDSPIELSVEFEISEGMPSLMTIKFRDEEEVLRRVEPPSPSAIELEEYVGVYYSSELRIYYRVGVSRGRLVFKHRRAPRASLKPVMRDIFVVTDPYMMVRFIRRKDGEVVGFTVATSRSRGVYFEKIT